MHKSQECRQLDDLIFKFMSWPKLYSKGAMDAAEKCFAVTAYAQGIDQRTILKQLRADGGVEITLRMLQHLFHYYDVHQGSVPADYIPAASINGDKPETPALGTHLADYKRIRRGFDIPPDKEPQYTQLLISGLSREQAARKMGALS